MAFHLTNRYIYLSFLNSGAELHDEPHYDDDGLRLPIRERAHEFQEPRQAHQIRQYASETGFHK